MIEQLCCNKKNIKKNTYYSKIAIFGPQIYTFLEDIDPDLLIAAEKYNINVFLILRQNFS